MRLLLSRGQFSSLQAGLHEVLNRGRDAAVITLVDRPPVSVATVQLLREAFESALQNIWAVVPEVSGRHGHPYLAGRELIEIFLQALPREHRYAFELRDPSWMTDDVYELLRRYDTAFCIYELAGYQSPIELTAADASPV